MHQRTRNGHHAIQVFPGPQEVTQDVLERLRRSTSRYWSAVAVLGALFLAGVAGFLVRLQGGFEDRAAWGYYAVTFVFLLSTFQAAPVVSMATRLVKGHWRRPLARTSELFAVVGILNFLLFLPLLFLIPPLEGRRTIWMAGPAWPHVWDALALLGLAVCGLALLYTAALPDFAAVRDHATGGRRAFYAALARGWMGTKRQWRVVLTVLNILGCFYLMMFVFTHLLVATDFAMSMVPGWVDSIFPAFHALSSLQSGVAITLVAMGILRWVGGYDRYLALDQFWGLAKLLLALSLLWFYFWWSGFIVMWYGRTPNEQAILELLMFGPYRPVFLLAFLLNFVAPVFFILIWNPFRVSIPGPFIAGCLVLVGNLLDRIRLYVAAFSIEEVAHFELEHVPATHLPDLADLLIMVGGISGALLLYLLAARIIPRVSMWEMREVSLLRVIRPFLRGEVVTLAKPE